MVYHIKDLVVYNFIGCKILKNVSRIRILASPGRILHDVVECWVLTTTWAVYWSP